MSPSEEESVADEIIEDEEKEEEKVFPLYILSVQNISSMLYKYLSTYLSN